jgi:hypothetical protein
MKCFVQKLAILLLLSVHPVFARADDGLRRGEHSVAEPSFVVTAKDVFVSDVPLKVIPNLRNLDGLQQFRVRVRNWRTFGVRAQRESLWMDSTVCFHHLAFCRNSVFFLIGCQSIGSFLGEFTSCPRQRGVLMQPRRNLHSNRGGFSGIHEGNGEAGVYPISRVPFYLCTYPSTLVYLHLPSNSLKLLLAYSDLPARLAASYPGILGRIISLIGKNPSLMLCLSELTIKNNQRQSGKEESPPSPVESACFERSQFIVFENLYKYFLGLLGIAGGFVTSGIAADLVLWSGRYRDGSNEWNRWCSFLSWGRVCLGFLLTVVSAAFFYQSALALNLIN